MKKIEICNFKFKVEEGLYDNLIEKIENIFFVIELMEYKIRKTKILDKKQSISIEIVGQDQKEYSIEFFKFKSGRLKYVALCDESGIIIQSNLKTEILDSLDKISAII